MKTLIINGTEIEVPEKAVGFFKNSGGNYMWISSLGALYITLNATDFIRAKADKFYSCKPFHKGKSNPLWHKSITLLSELDETTEPKLVGKREWREGDLFMYRDAKYLLAKNMIAKSLSAINMRTGLWSHAHTAKMAKYRGEWEYIGNVRNENEN